MAELERFTIFGGNRSDEIIGNYPIWPYYIIYGGHGNDFIYGAESAFGGEGDDYITYSFYAEGGEGDDTFDWAADDAQMYGGNGNDTFLDFYGSQSYFGGAGSDYLVLYGLNRYDDDENYADLGSGDDFAYVEDGATTTGEPFVELHGGDGFDTLYIDHFYGSIDFSTMAEGATLTFRNFTISGFERVYGFNNASRGGLDGAVVRLGDYDDKFAYDGAAETVFGGGGSDHLVGNQIGGFLYGEDGDDLIVVAGSGAYQESFADGGAGDDTIYMSDDDAFGGHAIVAGGEGSDGFIDTWTGQNSRDWDIVTDFDVSSDWIGLAPHGFRVEAGISAPMRVRLFHKVENRKVLSFELRSRDLYGPNDIEVIYNKIHGGLRLIYDYRKSRRFVLEGAPDLDFSHFFVMTNQYGTWGKETLHGGSNDDVLGALRGDDLVYGFGGDDTLFGDTDWLNPDEVFKDKDTLYGGDGNDLLCGGADSDLLVGGDGADIISYQTSNSGVLIDLSTNTFAGDCAIGDVVESIEGIAGSHNDDILIGDAGNNILIGNRGNDTLVGCAGADILAGSQTATIQLRSDGARDVYQYRSISDSGVSKATSDTIWGYFNGGGDGGDVIDVSQIDADGGMDSVDDAFEFIGEQKFDGTRGQIRVERFDDRDAVIVSFNTDDDLDAEMTIVVMSINDLKSGDFVL